MRLRFALLALVLGPAVVGQKMPDPRNGAWEIQVHDLRPVLEKVLQVRPSPWGVGEEDASPKGALTDLARDQVAKVIGVLRHAIAPPLEDPEVLQSLGDGLLVLRAKPEQHISLRGILRHWSEVDNAGVPLEVRSFRVQAGDITGALGEILGMRWGEGEDVEAVLAPDKARRLEEVLEGDPDVEPLTDTKHHLLPCQQGTCSSQETVRYRRDYVVEVVDGNPKIWPITGEIKNGLSVQVRSAPIDAETSAVVVDASWVLVQRPIPTFRTTLAGEKEKLVIDLPEAKGHGFSVTMRLHEGQLGVLVGKASADGSRFLTLVEVGKRE